jgi:hypothetical protein
MPQQQPVKWVVLQKLLAQHDTGTEETSYGSFKNNHYEHITGANHTAGIAMYCGWDEVMY